MDDAESQSQSNSELDLSSILGLSTSEHSDTAQPTGGQPVSKDGNGSSDAFRFGGRGYKSQQDAEKAHNQLYGKFSDQQSLLNQLKGALKDPDLLSALSRDQRWAPILAKLGVEQASQELEAQQEREDGEFDQERFVRDIRTQMAELSLEREEYRFERQLGRAITSEERNAVLEIIKRISSLSYAEAWKLANHDKLLRELQTKTAASGKAKSNRPSPVPSSIPGVRLDMKKNPQEMGAAEFREYLRASPEFQNLMSG